MCMLSVGMYPRYETGDIILVGGGPMPPGLIKSIAEMKPYGKFVLVSSDDKIGKKWKDLLALVS